MNILIAGGSGLIGHALTGALLDRGDQVWILTRNPESARLPQGTRAVGWDARTSMGWEESLAQADVVVNLAGENIGALPWTNERKQRIRASRVAAGQALVEGLEKSQRRPRVLVQISAIGIYGPHADEPLTEQASPGSDYLAGVAVDWENATQAAESLGVRRVVPRVGLVLTDQGGLLPRFLYPWKLGLGGPLGSGRQWMSWIHVQDVIRAMLALMQREDANGVYNLTAPEPVTNAEFGRTLAEVLGRPYWLPVPAFGLQALLGEMSTLVLDGQRVLPERLAASGFGFAYPRLKSALEILVDK